MQPVASTLDVNDVTVMQQPVQDRSGQHLVTGQQFRPVLDPLVGGDQDRAPAVPVTDQAEEQAGSLTVHWLEAHLVDDQQPDIEVLASAQLRRWQVGIALQGGDQFLPFSTALTSRAMARWALLTPSGLWINRISRARSQAQVARVSIWTCSMAGWKAKSKLFTVCLVGRS